MLKHQELTKQIICIYYNVYNGTSRNFPEYLYEKAMILDLREAGLYVQHQLEYEIYYKDRLVGLQILDILVSDEIIIELKVVPSLNGLHKAQLLSYLKVFGKDVGLLLNFGGPLPQTRRFDYRRAEEVTNQVVIPDNWPDNLLSPELTYEVIGALMEVHSTFGPGFIHRIYANATYYELFLRDLPVYAHSEYLVIYRNRAIGELKLNHIQVGDDLMVFPLATGNINDFNTHNLKAWMAYQNITIGIIANFSKSNLKFKVLINQT